MISALFSRLIILTFGTLYPAYASYKAVRTKNIKEYVKWMMYWIVFAFFTFFETFTDIFLSWFPFYYEVKIVIVFWLLSPATKGSSTLYRRFVHPMLTRREQEIDDYINQAKERGYSAVLQLGSKSVNYATNVIMQTAIKGGGNLVQSIKRSYSLSDLSEPDIHRTQEELDSVSSIDGPPQRILRPRQQAVLGRSSSGTRHSTGMYFSDVMPSKGDLNYNIRSSEDISSGYSSAEPMMGSLSRTSSMSNASKHRLKAKRGEINIVRGDDRLRNNACGHMPRTMMSFYGYNLDKDLVYFEDGNTLVTSPEQLQRDFSRGKSSDTEINHFNLFHDHEQIESFKGVGNEDEIYNNEKSDIDTDEFFDAEIMNETENRNTVEKFDSQQETLLEQQSQKDDKMVVVDNTEAFQRVDPLPNSTERTILERNIQNTTDEAKEVQKPTVNALVKNNEICDAKIKALTNLINTLEDSEASLKRKALHNKGKAPPPPNFSQSQTSQSKKELSVPQNNGCRVETDL